MIPKRRKPAKMGLRQAPQIRSASHLAWVRGHECSISGKAGHICFGKIQAMHARIGTDGGMGVKPGDNWTLPGCADAHQEQHAIGEQSFEAKYGISMRAIAEQLWLRSPHGIKYRAGLA